MPKKEYSMVKNDYCIDDMSYYFNYNKVPVLSKEEERDLIVLAVNGDKKSKDKLVLGNMRFAYYMAKKYKNCGMEFLDLFEECVYGLIKAVNSIDLKYDNRFSTYARFWIMKAVNNALNTCGNTMHLSERDFRLMKKVRTQFNILQNEGVYSEDSYAKIIAEKLSISIKKVKDLLTVSQNTKSFEQAGNSKLPNNGNKERGYEDIIEDKRYLSPEDEFFRIDVKNDVNKAMEILSEKEYEVINLHYGLDNNPPLSFSEIGAVCGLTKSWANYTEKQAIKIIKENYPQLEVYIA